MVLKRASVESKGRCFKVRMRIRLALVTKETWGEASLKMDDKVYLIIREIHVHPFGGNR